MQMQLYEMIDDQKGIDLSHNFYVFDVNNVVQKKRTRVTNTISLYKLTNILLLFICFKLVMKLMKFCKFNNIF